MEYEPPDASDLANIFSLNRAFLGWLAGRREQAPATSRLPPALVGRITALAPRRARHLAASPFLLFGFADGDERRWQAIFEAAPDRDLFADGMQPDRGQAELLCAALGFLWDLSRRRPYVARVLCRADPGWCERLADCALVDVLQRAVATNGMLGLIRSDDENFWHRLLGAGTDEDAAIRRAARLAALQTLLTGPPKSAYTRLPAAACAMPRPERTRR